MKRETVAAGPGARRAVPQPHACAPGRVGPVPVVSRGEVRTLARLSLPGPADVPSSPNRPGVHGTPERPPANRRPDRGRGSRHSRGRPRPGAAVRPPVPHPPRCHLWKPAARAVNRAPGRWAGHDPARTGRERCARDVRRTHFRQPTRHACTVLPSPVRVSNRLLSPVGGIGRVPLSHVPACAYVHTAVAAVSLPGTGPQAPRRVGDGRSDGCAAHCRFPPPSADGGSQAPHQRPCPDGPRGVLHGTRRRRRRSTQRHGADALRPAQLRRRGG